MEDKKKPMLPKADAAETRLQDGLVLVLSALAELAVRWAMKKK